MVEMCDFLKMLMAVGRETTQRGYFKNNFSSQCTGGRDGDINDSGSFTNAHYRINTIQTVVTINPKMRRNALPQFERQNIFVSEVE